MLDLEYLHALHERHRDALHAKVAEFTIGGRSFPFNSQPAIMGVINLSADSWYRESVCLGTEQAVRRGVTLAAQGAHLVDIGAESSLPRSRRVDERGQTEKIVPVVEALGRAGVLTSVETYLPEVARECLRAGAHVVNLTGRQDAEAAYRAVAEFDAAVIICYVQGRNVRDVGDFAFEGDPVALMYEYFAREIEKATALGVRRIVVDAGLGFYYRNLQDGARRIRHQMTTFLSTFRLRTLGFPVCQALPHAFECFAEEVRSAEPFFAVLAALGRTDLFRTHEVPRVKAVLDTLRLF